MDAASRRALAALQPGGRRQRHRRVEPRRSQDPRSADYGRAHPAAISRHPRPAAADAGAAAARWAAQAASDRPLAATPDAVPAAPDPAVFPAAAESALAPVG